MKQKTKIKNKKSKIKLIYIVLENTSIYNQYKVTKVFDSFKKAEKYLLDSGYEKIKSIYRKFEEVLCHAMILEKGVE